MVETEARRRKMCRKEIRRGGQSSSLLSLSSSSSFLWTTIATRHNDTAIYEHIILPEILGKTFGSWKRGRHLLSHYCWVINVQSFDLHTAFIISSRIIQMFQMYNCWRVRCSRVPLWNQVSCEEMLRLLLIMTVNLLRSIIEIIAIFFPWILQKTT